MGRVGVREGVVGRVKVGVVGRVRGEVWRGRREGGAGCGRVGWVVIRSVSW